MQMQLKHKAHFIVIPVMTFCTLLTTSVVSADCSKTKDKIKVEQRALKRWDALIAHDLKQAYKFLSPSVKELKSYKLYQAKIRFLQWKKAEVNKLTCNDDVCTINLQITYDHAKMSNVKTLLTETWIKNKEEWWLSVKK